MLMGMGFGRDHVIKALKSCSQNVERAADWLFSHPEGEDTPDTNNTQGAGSAPIQVHDGPGRYRLLALVSHIGSSTSHGHYVCHIRKEGNWVLFDDRKVALSKDPPREMAYLYFYQRI